jgi:cobaltochelatase CobT
MERDAVGVAFLCASQIGDRPMRHNPFESQLERLARTLTDRYGVQVVCQGEGAYTDGKRIVLPSLPEPMTAPLERMIVGFLDHEMSHVAFSDFKVVKTFATKHPGYFGILNAVEDAFIEKRAMRRWPGVRANLDAMFEQIRDRVRRKLQQADSFHRFSCAVYFKLSHHREMLGTESETVGYEDLLADFPGVRSTKDVAALSERILDRWLAKRAANQQSPTDGSSSQQQGGKSASNDNAASESQSEVSESNPDSLASESSGAEPPGNGQSSGQPATRESAPSQGSDTTTDEQAAANDNAHGQSSGECAGNANGAGGHGGTLITEALGEAIADEVQSNDGSQTYRVYTKAHDRVSVVPAASERDVQELLTRGTDTIRRLHRGLVNALRSAEKRWWREDQSRGALSPRTLHRLCIDQPRLDVFRTKSTVQGRSTAVCLALDASGSMTARKMEVARDAVRVLIEALATLNVATETFTFTTGDDFDMSRATAESNEDVSELRERFSRLSNLQIGLIKSYDEPVKVALRRLPSVRGTGLTPLGEAMQIGAARLIVRPETRKIMLVVTDGRAGCEGGSPAAHNHARNIASRITSAGIELIGVGIKDDNVTKVIDDSLVVHEIQDLPGQLCKLLARTLKKGLRHVG